MPGVTLESVSAIAPVAVERHIAFALTLEGCLPISWSFLSADV